MGNALRLRSGYDQTVAGLIRKRQELLDDIRDRQSGLSAAQSALDAIEGALRVFDPTIPPATAHQRKGGQIEGLYRAILDQLRRDGRVTTVSVADALMAAQGLDVRDKALRTAMRKRAGDALRRMKQQGRVTGERYGAGGELEWRLANYPNSSTKGAILIA